MSAPSQAQPEAQPSGGQRPTSAGTTARPGPARGDQQHALCPSCGSPMRLWANYHRCGNCGYKESCCF